MAPHWEHPAGEPIGIEPEEPDQTFEPPAAATARRVIRRAGGHEYAGPPAAEPTKATER